MRSCGNSSGRQNGVDISYHTGDEGRKEVSSEDRDEEDFQDKKKKVFSSNKKRHAMNIEKCKKKKKVLRK